MLVGVRVAGRKPRLDPHAERVIADVAEILAEHDDEVHGRLDRVVDWVQVNEESRHGGLRRIYL